MDQQVHFTIKVADMQHKYASDCVVTEQRRMVVDAQPGALGIAGDADIAVAGRIFTVADGAGAGLVDVACFTACDSDGAAVLILDAPPGGPR